MTKEFYIGNISALITGEFTNPIALSNGNESINGTGIIFIGYEDIPKMIRLLQEILCNQH